MKMKTTLDLQYDVAINKLSNCLAEAGVTAGDINTIRVKGQKLVEGNNQNKLSEVFVWLESIVAQKVNEEQAQPAPSKEQVKFAKVSELLKGAVNNYFNYILALGGGKSVVEERQKMIRTVNNFTNQVLQKKFKVGVAPQANPFATQSIATTDIKAPQPQAQAAPQANPFATQSVIA